MADKWPNVECYTIVASICTKANMARIFAQYHPDYVFHAAAYKHVPMMEDKPSESIRNNVVGTKIIADLSVAHGVKKFVMISTDKAVNPTNVMGCSKRICEIYVQSLDAAIKSGLVKGNTQFVTTRFGNVLGSNGSVIPIFREQIKKGGPLTVTHPDINRFFMLIPEACRLVLEAGVKGNGGEIFVFDMGESVRIAELAKRMIKLSEADNVEIKYTGLRPGEKLYEEVLSTEETTVPSFHNKIMRRVKGLHLSIHNENHSVAKFCGIQHIVGGDNDRFSFVTFLQNHVLHNLGIIRVQPTGGLVQEKDLRVMHQGLNEIQSGFHAFGESGNLFVCMFQKPHFFQQFINLPFPAAIQGCKILKIFPCGKLLKEAWELKIHTYVLVKLIV